jgi:YVTN family beta-propeller protein
MTKIARAKNAFYIGTEIAYGVGILCLVVLLVACDAQSVPLATLAPTFAPTNTREITPVPLILTPIHTPIPIAGLPPLRSSQSSKSLALHGSTLVTANMDSDSITIVDTTTNIIVAEIAVGDDPRAVAITPDGTKALVTLRGDNVLTIVSLSNHTLENRLPVGHMPYGVVTNGHFAYISCLADNQVVAVDLQSGAIVQRFDVPDSPAGLTLSDDTLLVTHFYSGKVTLINLTQTPAVTGTVIVEPDGHLSQSIAIAPDGEQAFLPGTRTGLSLISLQYMQDWFPVVGVLDISTMAGLRNQRLTLSQLYQASNMPFDAAFTEDGESLYIVLAGSDTVLALNTGDNTLQVAIPVGANPRGIVLDAERAYVLNALDSSLSVIDIDSNSIIDTLQLSVSPLDEQILLGKKLFHSAVAPIMSDGAISCATCHFDGGMDRRTWINFRNGPRNTPALTDLALYPPYNWAGEMLELHDTIEDQIRYVMLGDGLIDGVFDPTGNQLDAGRSYELDALAAYVLTFESMPSPYLEADGSLSESAKRGMQLFMSGSIGCNCHAPPLYTDLRQHNLTGATFALENYTAFDTPTLRGIWTTAPYMHDGVVLTLEELLSRTDPTHSVATKLSEQELRDLIAFLLSL